MSKLLSSLSEIIITCHSSATSQVIKSTARSSLILACGGGTTNSISSPKVPWDAAHCAADQTPRNTGGWLKLGCTAPRSGLGWFWGSDRTGPGCSTSQFGVENREHSRAYMDIGKSFASVEKWSTIKKNPKQTRRGGAFTWRLWLLPEKHQPVMGYSENSHNRILFNSLSVI